MIQGIGTGTILPLMFTVAMNIFPPEKLGTAAYHGTNHAAAFTNGIHFGMLFTVVLTVIGFLIALSLKKEPKSADIPLEK